MDPEPSTLKATAEAIAALLKERQPRWIESVPADLHPLPPFLSRNEWGQLGDLLRLAEQPSLVQIPGEKWISLRCDGTGFSKLTKRLQREGIFQQGYSPEFAALMKACCRALMNHFPTAACGYTQSDEITILIPPASVVRGEQQAHMYSGRIQKLCSLAAATVTSTFVSELLRLCIAKNHNKESVLPRCTPTFDCRVGVYDTQMEALSLVLWRSCDCGINATSDAVYKSGIAGAKAITAQTTDTKLVWLMEHNLLPLPPHQREGTLLVKRMRLCKGWNPKTGESVTYLRSRVEQLEGCVLQMFKNDCLFGDDLS